MSWERFWRRYDRGARVEFAGTLLGLIFDWKNWLWALPPSGGAVTFLWAAIVERDPLDVWVTAVVVTAGLAIAVYVVTILLDRWRAAAWQKLPADEAISASSEVSRPSPTITDWQEGKWEFKYPPAKAEPMPDLNAAEAFNTIVARSRRAEELALNPERLRPGWYEKGMEDAEWIRGRIKDQLDREIHDFLSLGKLRAWGRTNSDRPWTLIRSDEWKDIELQFDERTLGSIPPNVCAVRRRNDPRSSSIAYVLVHFFSTEFYTRFPINEAAVQKHPRLAPARLAVAKVLDDLYAEGVGHRNELILAIENFDHELERQKLIDWSNRVIAKSDDEYVAMREKSDFRTLNLFEPIFHSSKGKTRQQQDLEAMWTEKLARLKVIVRKVGS